MTPLPTRHIVAGSGEDLEPGTYDTAPMAGASIARGSALALVVAFCAFLVTPAFQEWGWSPASTLPARIRADIGAYGLQLGMNQIEQRLVFDSKFANQVRRPYQRWLISLLRQGSRTVLIGADGFWFHRSETTMLAGPGILSADFNRPRVEGRDVVDDVSRAAVSRLRGRPAPPPALHPGPATNLEVLEDFHQQLKGAGVHLLVVLVPGKLMIYPERLSPRYSAAAGPARNADFSAFVERLARTGVDVLDLSDPFWTAKDGFEPLYLRRDTHWSPAGLALAADLVARRVRPVLNGQTERVTYSSRSLEVPEPMDLLNTLGLRDDAMYQGERTVTVTAVSPTPEAAGGAPVILFGDSLSGYYSEQGAGLASQLALRLSAGVRSFVGFGSKLPGAVNGAFRDATLLRGVQVVVLEMQIGQLFSRTFSSRFELKPSN